MKEEKRLTLGIIIEDMSETCQATIWRGIKDVCVEKGIDMITFVGEFFLDYHRQEMHYLIFKDFTHKENIDGLIILAGSIVQYYDYNIIFNLLNGIKPLPIVSIGVKFSDIPEVIADNKDGMFQVVDHLLGYHNKRRIAFIKGPQGHHEAAQRFIGYLAAFEKHGLPIDNDLILSGDFSEESGIKAVELLVDKHHARFDAIVCSDDLVASGVLKALSARNIAVPDDVAVVGFDDLHDFEITVESLATVGQNFYNQGREAVLLVMGNINGTSEKNEVVIPTTFIPGHSCGCRRPVEKSEENDNTSITTLMDAIGGVLTNEALPPDRVDSLKNELHDVITKHFNTNAIPQSLQPYNYQKLYRLIRVMFSSLSLDTLYPVLYKELPQFHIKSCYIVLYNNGQEKISTIEWALPATSMLVFGYKDCLQIIDDEPIVFPTAQILPDRIESYHRQKNMIFLPLSYKHEHYGYIVFEYTQEEPPLIYETLRIYLSSVISSAYLFEELKRNAIQKTNYFTNLAHETRTPLTLISNYLDKYYTDHKDDHDLLLIKQYTDKLKRDMINFLDLTKIEKGLFFYNHNQVVDLSSVLKPYPLLFKSVADRYGITIHAQIEEGLVINIDPSAIDRIINNLLDNAIRYNKRGGEIVISLKKQDEQVVLSIKDTGIGIDDMHYANIFKPYYQISHHKSNLQGIGLGLNIVKKIIDDIGADITVESTLQVGTVFTITFNNGGDAGGEVINEISYSAPGSDSYHRSLKNRRFVSNRFNVMIIEDNLDMLAYLHNSFAEKYNVFYAVNGKEGLQKIRTIPRPHVIISDIMMDVMDGYKFHEELLKDDTLKSIPLIFLTARTAPDERLKGLNQGAVDFISKPFRIEELIAKVDALIALGTKQKERDLQEFQAKILEVLDNDDYNRKEEIFENNCRKFGITPREQEVIELLFEGKEVKEISAIINVSFHTVRKHIRNIYYKCHVQNKVELINVLKGM